MSGIKMILEDFKRKAEGEVKETIGIITGNQELELEGKIINKASDIKENISGVKDHLLEKINDKIDQSEK